MNFSLKVYSWSEEDRLHVDSPPALRSAARSVLQTIASVRKKNPCRSEAGFFLSGNVLETAVGEVRSSFGQEKEVDHKRAHKNQKRRGKFKHVIACLASPDITLNPSRKEWDKLVWARCGKDTLQHAFLSGYKLNIFMLCFLL